MKDDSPEILFQSFSEGGPCEQFWHGQGCPLFDVADPAFPLPTTALPTLQDALKDGFKEAVLRSAKGEAYDLKRRLQERGEDGSNERRERERERETETETETETERALSKLRLIRTR